MTRARGARAAVPAGLACVVLALALAGCGAAAGDEAGEPTSGATPSASATPMATPESPEPAAGRDGVVVGSASLGAAAARQHDDAGQVPTEIRYDRLGWSVPVDAVGVADDGQMEIPEDALRAGWYRFGPGAGAGAGTTVVAAHAGSYITPEGPFWDLRGAREGDVVELDRADGGTVRYEVTSVETIEKTTIDLGPIFARDGDPRLVLITCGGVWDDDAQSYESNVVVTAVPTGD
jgi:LPXTG-site transpeptidase (sortase) family protein